MVTMGNQKELKSAHAPLPSGTSQLTKASASAFVEIDLEDFIVGHHGTTRLFFLSFSLPAVFSEFQQCPRA